MRIRAWNTIQGPGSRVAMLSLCSHGRSKCNAPLGAFGLMLDVSLQQHTLSSSFLSSLLRSCLGSTCATLYCIMH